MQQIQHFARQAKWGEAGGAGVRLTHVGLKIEPFARPFAAAYFQELSRISVEPSVGNLTNSQSVEELSWAGTGNAQWLDTLCDVINPQFPASCTVIARHERIWPKRFRNGFPGIRPYSLCVLSLGTHLLCAFSTPYSSQSHTVFPLSFSLLGFLSLRGTLITIAASSIRAGAQFQHGKRCALRI